MNQRTTAILGVVIMSTLLVLYFYYAGLRAVALFQTGTPVAIALGTGLLILPLLGVWALLRELKFGRDATKLVDELDRIDRVPIEDIATLPSGKPVREEADLVFDKYRDEVQANETSWEAWARLGIMYDACGDRTRGRKALRTAIALKKRHTV